MSLPLDAVQSEYVTFVGSTFPLLLHIPPPLLFAEQVVNDVLLTPSSPAFHIPPPDKPALHKTNVQSETLTVTPLLIHIPPPEPTEPEPVASQLENATPSEHLTVPP
ncbi:MAG: hypothetical protein HDR53_06535 [Treponema sp.]|nr:hypothetical protein [Treponema sp.]